MGKMKTMRTIWVVNHGGHNIEAAIRDFNPVDVQYITEGSLRLDEVDRIMYHAAQNLKGSFDYEQDALLLCGGIVINMIVAIVLFAYLKVPRVTVLIWDRDRRFYYARTLDPGGIDPISLESMDA